MAGADEARDHLRAKREAEAAEVAAHFRSVLQNHEARATRKHDELKAPGGRLISILIVTAYNIFQSIFALVTAFEGDFHTFFMSLILGIAVLTLNVFLIKKHSAAFYLMLLWYVMQSGSIILPTFSLQFLYGFSFQFAVKVGAIQFGFNPIAMLAAVLLLGTQTHYLEASRQPELSNGSGELDMQNSRSAHPILYVIAALLLVNVGLTVWMLASETRRSAQVASGQRPLPTSLTSTERQALFETFRTKYNGQDFDGIYEMLSDVAKVHVSQQQNRDTLQRIGGLVGDIELGAYSHYEHQKAPGQPDYFQLYYTVRYSIENRTGRLLIGVLGTGEDYGILNYNMGFD